MRRLWFVAGLLVARAASSSSLRSAADLTDNCFDFPATPFSRINNIKSLHGSSPHIFLRAGHEAIDFTLRDTDGELFTLSDELDRGRPVVLLWGMYTCPAFQGLGGAPPFDECAYWDENAVVEAFQDRVTFVHLYGPEPHPYTPDANFDSGNYRLNYWSTVRQPLTFEGRAKMALRIRPSVHPAARILVDSFPGNPDSELINPVWCSYVTGARAAIAVGADGVIFHASTWFNRGDITVALMAHLVEAAASG